LGACYRRTTGQVGRVEEIGMGLDPVKGRKLGEKRNSRGKSLLPVTSEICSGQHQEEKGGQRTMRGESIENKSE